MKSVKEALLERFFHLVQFIVRLLKLDFFCAFFECCRKVYECIVVLDSVRVGFEAVHDCEHGLDVAILGDELGCC